MLIRRVLINGNVVYADGAQDLSLDVGDKIGTSNIVATDGCVAHCTTPLTSMGLLLPGREKWRKCKVASYEEA